MIVLLEVLSDVGLQILVMVKFSHICGVVWAFCSVVSPGCAQRRGCHQMGAFRTLMLDGLCDLRPCRHIVSRGVTFIVVMSMHKAVSIFLPFPA